MESRKRDSKRLSSPLSNIRNNRIESDHRSMKRRLRSMQGPPTAARTRALIQDIEAIQMIRKGQVLGISRASRYGQAWVFRSLLGLA